MMKNKIIVLSIITAINLLGGELKRDEIVENKMLEGISTLQRVFEN